MNQKTPPMPSIPPPPETCDSCPFPLAKESIKATLSALTNAVEEIHVALLGNPRYNVVGLVHKLADVELRLTKLRVEFDAAVVEHNSAQQNYELRNEHAKAKRWKAIASILWKVVIPIAAGAGAFLGADKVSKAVQILIQ